MDRIVQKISRSHPCREKIIAELYELIADPRDCSPNGIYLYGHTGTGKTAVVTRFLRRSMCKCAVVNCIECYTPKILYETIVNALEYHFPSKEDNYAPHAKCENLKEFLEVMRELDPVDSYVICLDNAERLRDMEFNILPAFLRLQELTGLNICTLLISQLPFEKFFTKTGLSEVITIHCPQYTKGEVETILSLDFDIVKQHVKSKLMTKALDENSDVYEGKNEILESLEKDFYDNYLSVFLNVFYRACRDLPELRMISRDCFENYCEPVLNKTVDRNDVSKLWRNISKHLKTALSTVYLRIDKSTEHLEGDTLLQKGRFMEKHRLACPCVAGIIPKKKFISIHTHRTPPETHLENTEESLEVNHSVKKLAKSLELPYYAKFLLIAAFLASYNAPKEDKRLFVKNHGKQKKRLQSINAKAKVTDKLSTALGPKSFSIDRLLAIFYAILDEKVGLTCNLLAQISSLVHLKLLSFVSGENNIMEGSARLQCTVGLDFILHIGRLVGFNVTHYLSDFNH